MVSASELDHFELKTALFCNTFVWNIKEIETIYSKHFLFKFDN